MALWALCSTIYAEEGIAEIFADPKMNLKRTADRDKVIKKLQAHEQAIAVKTRAEAKASGLKIRTEVPNHKVSEIVDFKGDEPVYATTRNRNSAVTTGAISCRLHPIPSTAQDSWLASGMLGRAPDA